MMGVEFYVVLMWYDSPYYYLIAFHAGTEEEYAHEVAKHVEKLAHVIGLDAEYASVRVVSEYQMIHQIEEVHKAVILQPGGFRFVM